MGKASKELLTELEETINDAADGLSKVAGKRMFGCHALFANDSVFGLVWKEGRIGVRLPEEESYEKLIGLSGAVPWKAGAMVMSHWVLVPPAMHKDKAKLAGWVATAHKQALAAPKKSAAKSKKKTSSKSGGAAKKAKKITKTAAKGKKK